MFQMGAMAAATTTGLQGSFSCAVPPSERLNLAIVGAGGRGEANLKELGGHNIIAICDVDEERAAGALRKYSEVPHFRDFRVMMDRLSNSIDGVVISTPDHTHFHIARTALEYNKHVYLEKPMAHSLWETRTLTALAREKGVATQLGMQRHAVESVHRVVELIRAGAIGTVSEVHCWIDGKRGMPPIPQDAPPVPPELDWDLWLGPVPPRPYSPAYCPYNWRFWWDFGTGETGNWGCHILDIPFWALELKYPTRVGATGPPPHPQTTPVQMSTWFDFPATEARPALRLHWHHAEKGPDILREHKLPYKDNNTLFIGSEGMLLCGFRERKLLPEEKFRHYAPPEPDTPDSPGFWEEWVQACKGGPRPTCHWDYAGPVTEAVLLGNLAYRVQAEFAWDGEALKANHEGAQALVKPVFRDGWKT